MPSKATSSGPSLLNLPAELLTITAYYLPYPDLLALQLSCHYLSSLLSATVSGRHLSPVEQMERWDRLPPRCPTELQCANCVKWGWGERVADALSRDEKMGVEGEETSRSVMGKEKGKGRQVITSSNEGVPQQSQKGEKRARNWGGNQRGRTPRRGRGMALGSANGNWRDR